MNDIPIELVQALADSADDTGCDIDLVVVSSNALAAVLRAAGIVQFSFECESDLDDDE